ncbi:subtilisin-like protein [Trametopsis cervina]|nr:subtilisin-like protein [Trametopsis cervina]
MLLSTALKRLTLLTASTSCLASSAFVRHESRSSLPANWARSERVPADTILPLRIGLKQPNLEYLEEYLLDISHPASPNYGNHWSADKIVNTFRPNVEAIDTVREWLIAEGVEPSGVKLTKTGGWLEANVSVSQAESLLKTEYYTYLHEPTDTRRIGCDAGYHLPEHVAKHVDLVTPTIHFDTKLKRRSNSRPESSDVKRRSSNTMVKTVDHISHSLDDCDKQLTPDCVRALYDYHYTPVAADKNSIAIAAYASQFYVPSDLDLFFSNFSKSQVGQRPVLVSVDGGTIDRNQTGFSFNVESNFDLSWAMVLVGEKQPVTLYQVGDVVDCVVLGASFNELLDALDGSYCTFEGGDDPSGGIDGIYPDPLPGGYKGHDCGTVESAYIISNSYAYSEADMTPFFATRQCAEFGKLGLMGITVLHSSGDGGVAGNLDLCLTPNGTQSESGNVFNPMFPATCPFVTGVGGTQIDTGKKVSDPESALQRDSLSSGGFSNYFSIPDYQKNAVGSFLQNHPPQYPTSIWNATGSRGFPDLAANGASVVAPVGGEFVIVSGTSAASPIVATLLSAVNDARLAIGKKPIGFINPVIYSAEFQDAFNDITHGDNPGCGTDGFSATKGWDPVTGLGTPDFPKLLEKWLALP